MSARKKTVLLKVLLVGEASVGKTSIFHRFVKNEYSDTYKATIGADFFSKQMNIENTEVIMQIWDTAGQERHRSLGASFFRGSDVCILVYDISNKKSFEALETWYEQFIQKVGCNSANPENEFIFVVLGNKCDLENREVDSDTATQFCQKKGLKFYETSALNGHNVQDAFEFIAQKGISKLELQLNDYPIDSITLDDDEEESLKGETGCMC